MGIGRLLIVIVAVSLTTLGAAPRPLAEHGAIRGRVSFPDSSPPIAARPGVSDLGGGMHQAVDRRRSVVYLDTVPRQAFDDLPTGRTRMDQRDEQFVPRLLAITVGTVVDFP